MLIIVHRFVQNYDALPKELRGGGDNINDAIAVELFKREAAFSDARQRSFGGLAANKTNPTPPSDPGDRRTMLLAAPLRAPTFSKK